MRYVRYVSWEWFLFMVMVVLMIWKLGQLFLILPGMSHLPATQQDAFFDDQCKILWVELTGIDQSKAPERADFTSLIWRDGHDSMPESALATLCGLWGHIGYKTEGVFYSQPSRGQHSFMHFYAGVWKKYEHGCYWGSDIIWIHWISLSQVVLVRFAHGRIKGH